MRTGLLKDDAGKVDRADPRKSCKHMYELGLHSEARGSHKRVLNFIAAQNTTRLLLDFTQFLEGLHFSHVDTELWSPLEERWVRTGENQTSSGRSPCEASA